MASDKSAQGLGLTHVASALRVKAEHAKTVVADTRKNKRRAEFVIFADSTDRWTWVLDEVEAFLPAKILKDNPDGSKEVEMNVTRAIRVVRKQELGPPITRLAELKNQFDGARRRSGGRRGQHLPRSPSARLHAAPCAPPPAAQTWCAWAT